MFLSRERIDETVRGRTGSDADHGAFGHIGVDIIGGGLADQSLEFVLSHGAGKMRAKGVSLPESRPPIAIRAGGRLLFSRQRVKTAST
jgi:hypothetical protein